MKDMCWFCGASLEVLESCQGNRPDRGVVGVLEHPHRRRVAVRPGRTWRAGSSLHGRTVKVGHGKFDAEQGLVPPHAVRLLALLVVGPTRLPASSSTTEDGQERIGNLHDGVGVPANLLEISRRVAWECRPILWAHQTSFLVWGCRWDAFLCSYNNVGL
jgi:hypothetical protein